MSSPTNYELQHDFGYNQGKFDQEEFQLPLRKSTSKKLGYQVGQKLKEHKSAQDYSMDAAEVLPANISETHA